MNSRQEFVAIRYENESLPMKAIQLEKPGQFRHIEIPEPNRPRDNRIKLGTLIGVVANSPADLKEDKAMVLDENTDFIAKKSGRLYLRMFDIDPSDNDGKLVVMIQSTFRK